MVDNPRYLILPWIHIPNLDPHSLAVVRRHLPLECTNEASRLANTLEDMDVEILR